jgi:hypothetical protein
MVLSETRGLQLCWVVRGGIGSAWRLGAEAHKSPNFWLDTLPRPERLKRNPTATAKDDPQGGESDSERLGWGMTDEDKRTWRERETSDKPGQEAKRC